VFLEATHPHAAALTSRPVPCAAPPGGRGGVTSSAPAHVQSREQPIAAQHGTAGTTATLSLVLLYYFSLKKRLL
jgi:hypothetical protein